MISGEDRRCQPNDFDYSCQESLSSIVQQTAHYQLTVTASSHVYSEDFLRSNFCKSARVSSYPHIRKSISYLLMIPSISLALDFLNTFSISTRLKIN